MTVADKDSEASIMYNVRRCLTILLLIIPVAGCSRPAGQTIAVKPTPSTSDGAAPSAPAPEKKPPAPDGEPVRSTEEQTIVSAAKAALQPVISALTLYHQQHGRYPTVLDDLVRDALLAKPPELPPVKDAFESALEYRASPLPDFFVLMFHYHVNFDKGSYRVIDLYRRVYASDDRRGWVKPDSPYLCIGELVADRLGPFWRTRHDPEVLGRFMTDAVASVDCEYLLQSKVTNWLGNGLDINVPPEVVGQGRTGHVYPADGEASRRYCFVYKKQWFAYFSCPSVASGKALAKGPLEYSSRPVVEKLFLIRRNEHGQESWEILRACPPSEHDVRPKSSRGMLVHDD